MTRKADLGRTVASGSAKPDSLISVLREPYGSVTTMYWTLAPE